MNTTTFTNDTQLISYCGFYCGACPKYKKGECEGCKGDSLKCAVGYKSCKVRPCVIEKDLSTCADCELYSSVAECKKYNPLLIRIMEFLTRTSRGKGIEMIKKKGEVEFVRYMIEKEWVTIKKGKH